jgi:nitrogen regulatory protein P-II 1
MKTVTAIIRPGKFSEVKEALLDMGVEMMTVVNVMGCGRQEGYTESHSKSSGEVNLIKKIRIEIIVPEEQVQQAVETIIKQSRTGNIGDGKIFVTDAPDYVSIAAGV